MQVKLPQKVRIQFKQAETLLNDEDNWMKADKSSRHVAS